ncbi:hypothetical protein H4Q26_002311 [Puccinia striiformis f. sp. tritici PST-130]|nr:hypothetical protein H4Q26_002311 [Puccinia striiformis f. sp. tritici PST-130]
MSGGQRSASEAPGFEAEPADRERKLKVCKQIPGGKLNGSSYTEESLRNLIPDEWVIGPTILLYLLKSTCWTDRSTLPSKVNLMDNNMESVWTDLSSGHALLANNKEYPSTSELSEPPALNPISNIEDDTARCC